MLRMVPLPRIAGEDPESSNVPRLLTREAGEVATPDLIRGSRRGLVGQT